MTTIDDIPVTAWNRSSTVSLSAPSALSPAASCEPLSGRSRDLPAGPPAAGSNLFRVHVAEQPWVGSDSGGIFVQLSQEWIRLGAMPSMAHTLRKWGRAEPVLSGAVSLGALVDLIDSSQGAEEDELLLALVRLAQAGQQLAGRVVLQAMLPKLARMVRTLRPTGNDGRWVEDRRHIAVAVFWEVLSAYPADRRRGRVAGNLALDTLHELTRDQRRGPADIPVDPEEAADRLGSCSYDEPRMQPAGLTADSDLLEVIAWGLDVEAITAEEASLLTQVYLPLPGTDASQAELAPSLGLSATALRQRCSRARRRLIAAVQADMEPQPRSVPACV